MYYRWNELLNDGDMEALNALDFRGILSRRTEVELDTFRGQLLAFCEDSDGNPTFQYLLIKMYLEAVMREAKDIRETTVTQDNIGDHNKAQGCIATVELLLGDGFGIVGILDEIIADKKAENG